MYESIRDILFSDIADKERLIRTPKPKKSMSGIRSAADKAEKKRMKDSLKIYVRNPVEDWIKGE